MKTSAQPPSSETGFKILGLHEEEPWEETRKAEGQTGVGTWLTRKPWRTRQADGKRGLCTRTPNVTWPARNLVLQTPLMTPGGSVTSRPEGPEGHPLVHAQMGMVVGKGLRPKDNPAFCSYGHMPAVNNRAADFQAVQAAQVRSMVTTTMYRPWVHPPHTHTHRKPAGDRALDISIPFSTLQREHRLHAP